MNNKPLVYFDNGATTQKPKLVIDSIVTYYSEQNANIHRGVHTLSREATELFEAARKTVSEFINAKQNEIIFTAGTTDSINIIAQGLNIPKGSEIIITQMEHHSNILPWQLWCERNEGKLKVVPINSDGSLQVDKLNSLVSSKTALIALAHVSNTLGVINPVKEIVQKAKVINSKVLILVDGAQSIPHMSVDVKDLGCDMFVFSGHKMYAPTGSGVLFVKEDLLPSIGQSRAGGGTIKTVTFENTEYADGPLRFEAGTPNIEAVVGLAKACEFMKGLGTKNISDHEHSLLVHAQKQLSAINEVEIYANHSNKAAVISFNVKGQHPFDVGTLLDKYGIAVRTGHHCTQPLMEFFGIQGTVRVSFAVYNTKEEVDVFIEALKKSIKILN